MVGEIRDHETAEIAIHASLTGHLVFSTLHTNDAAGAVTRLVDMGIEPFLVSSSVIAVLAQRLVRRVCPNCRASSAPTAEQLAEIGLTPERIGDAPIYRRATAADNASRPGTAAEPASTTVDRRGRSPRLDHEERRAATIRRQATITRDADAARRRRPKSARRAARPSRK